MPAPKSQIPDDELSFKDVAKTLGASGLRTGPAPTAAHPPPPGPLPSATPDATASLSSTAISPRHQLEAWLALMVKNGASDLILRAADGFSPRGQAREEAA